ncbi:solute carrier family 2, facilitated glucose transporter member 6 [Melanotaenia boesemani]|uniref:solute carrier family 2, facilitated glucose transporter member 6 n=1 Tax=Melanotaenia boesemani TaxID=1250792 RepID=UPI001C0581B7|nr:solute carrier family 2, facilitated glucose transporter member 6 [Melanotaenia boesemani]
MLSILLLEAQLGSRSRETRGEPRPVTDYKNQTAVITTAATFCTAANMDEETPLLNRRATSSGFKINNSRLFLAVFSAVLGNFNFGYSLVYSSPVLPKFKSPEAEPRLRMDTEQAAWFGSIYSLGAVAGGLGAMLLNDLIGRKLSIMMSAVPSTVGYMLMGGAVDLWMLHLGRFLTGVAGGMTAASIPVYISEISHKEVRGALGSCPQITAVFGTLTLYILGLVVPWRWLAVAGSVPAVLMVVLLVFMPSSPRRLLSLGRELQAEKALRWLRGPDYDTQTELRAIQHSINTQVKLTWSQLAKPIYYRPILISVVMRFLQQMTGVTPILVYLEPIFAKSKVSLEPRYDAAIVGAVRLCAVAIAAFLMDKAGRKALLYTSSMLMFASTLTLTMISHTTPCTPGPLNHTALDFISHKDLGTTLQASQQTATSLIPLISTVVFIFGYAMGWGPITWLLMSEVLPLVARGKASGLCVTVSWLTAFVLTHAFTHLVDSYGLYVPYLLFTVVCVLCLLFNAVCIPETRGRSLEEIENYFRTGRSFTIRHSDTQSS